MTRPRPPQTFMEALTSPYRSDRNWLYDLDADVGSVEATLADTADRLQREHQRVTDLSHVLAMLVRMLDEAGVVKTAELHARIEAELARIAAQREATGQVSCVRCHASVPRTSTNITAAGAVCDACFDAAGGA